MRFRIPAENRNMRRGQSRNGEKMIQIAICDDEVYGREELRKFIERYLEDNKYSYRICEFDSGEDFLGTEACFHGIFLDIEMGGISGLDVKEWLEKQKSNAFIVFVTNHGERMQEAFGEKVCAFLKKPVMPQDVEKALKKIIVNYRGCQKVSVKSEEGISEIEVQDILYIQGNHVYADICLCNGNRHITRETLCSLGEKLKQYGFLRIHKSYLVNMRGIDRATKSGVIMQDGTELAIGRKFREDFREKYHEYKKKRAKYV